MATLQKLGDDTLCPIEADTIKIGRSMDNDIVIEDDTVSGNHATIVKSDHDDGKTQFVIEDLRSTNHTYVNNKIITTHTLKEGDVVQIGYAKFLFSLKDMAPQKPDLKKTRKMHSNKLLQFIFSK